ncbi:MAG: hypothetical protein K2G07_07640 [Muribaculaceae bacterium]|nr:hypothetical protein [Muribaculaceae bacterium]
MKLMSHCLGQICMWLSRVASFIYSNRKPLILAFVWTAFILFFTYTALLVEAVKVNGSFYDSFYKSQSQFVAMFVNIGIIIMLLFDNHAVNKEFHGIGYYIPIVAIAICIMILAHCDTNNNKCLDDYITPISYEKLSVVLFCFFIIIIYCLKARTLWEVTTQKKGVN